jgi:hypothetical protein
MEETAGKRRFLSVEIGKVFPAGSPVARFIVRLCLAANDLNAVNKRSREEVMQSGEGGNCGRYFFYLACAHYREAIKSIENDLRKPEVVKFVGKLDKDSQATLAKLQTAFTPWKGSFVETQLVPLRNSVFHYFSDPEGDAELALALAEASSKESRINLSPENLLLNTRFDFADEVMAVLAGRALGGKDREKGLEEVLSRLPDLMVSYISFAHAALVYYLEHPWEVIDATDPGR